MSTFKLLVKIKSCCCSGRCFVVAVVVVVVVVVVLNVMLTTQLMIMTRRFLGYEGFLKSVSRFSIKGDFVCNKS